MMSLVNKSGDWTPNYHKILIFFPTKSLKSLRAARIDQIADSNEPANMYNISNNQIKSLHVNFTNLLIVTREYNFSIFSVLSFFLYASMCSRLYFPRHTSLHVSTGCEPWDFTYNIYNTYKL